MLQLFQNNYGQKNQGYAIEFLPIHGLPVEGMQEIPFAYHMIYLL